jgi:lactate dehydrogenase-like 2-hydroxyacid dehydrogenase
LFRNEYRNLKLSVTTIGRGVGRSEEDWKRWTNWGCNTYMHGNNTRKFSLCSHLYLKLAKTSCFLFNFYVFSSTKSENRKAEQVLQGSGLGGLGTGRIGEEVGKG